jgi:hypothetical protein
MYNTKRYYFVINSSKNLQNISKNLQIILQIQLILRDNYYNKSNIFIFY